MTEGIVKSGLGQSGVEKTTPKIRFFAILQ
jgi:hypothetical protein